MALALALLPLDFLLNLFLIPRFGLSGAAAATTLACLAGFIVSAFFVQKKFGRLMRGNSLLKILLSSFLLYIVTRLWPVSGWTLVPYGLGLFTSYIVLLTLLKEIRREDLKLFRNLWVSLAKRGP